MSTREFREKAESLTEQMIELLDRFDGDENLEDGADKEPSLGVSCDANGFIDTEADPGEEDVELGWTQDLDQARAHSNLAGTQWMANLEHEHEGKEPSLGAPEFTGNGANVNQERWAQGARDDREGGADDDIGLEEFDPVAGVRAS